MESVSQELLATRKPPRVPSADKNPPVLDAKPSLPKRILRNLAYAWIGFFFFLLFFLAKLPQEKIGRFILAQMTINTTYQWQAKEVRLGFLLGPSVTFSALELTPKTTLSRGQIQIEELSIRPDLFSILPIPGMKESIPAGNFSLKAFGGSASGYAAIGENTTAIQFSGSELALDKMHFLQDNYDLDIKGIVKEIQIDLNASGRWIKSIGNASATVSGLVLDPAGFQLGFPLPILDIGPATIKAQFNAGRLNLSGSNLGISGRDLELIADGGLNLKEPVEFSDLDLKVKLKFAEKITKVLPAVESALTSFKRSDGYYGLKFGGTFAAPGWPTLFSN